MRFRQMEKERKNSLKTSSSKRSLTGIKHLYLRYKKVSKVWATGEGEGPGGDQPFEIELPRN
jgi:hypothetical protein